MLLAGQGTELRFGSDGYRGIIGDSFSWQQISRLTAATAKYLHSQQISGDAIVPIGYDTRFLAPCYAKAVYHGLVAEGYRPQLAATFCPSPYLSFAVRRLDAPLGIMITASHNPARYLGFKLKGPEGGSALPEVTRAVEGHAAGEIQGFDPGPAFSNAATYDQFDLSSEYSTAMQAYASPTLPEFPFNFTVDFVHGTTAHLYLQVLRSLSVDFTAIHTEREPCFAGGNPEPVPEQLNGLLQRVNSTSGSFGAAFDGDGDRLGLIDESGWFVPPEDIYAICLLHLVEDRGLRGRVVKSISFSSLIDRVAKALGVEVVEVPVGFKHSTRELIKPGTLMAAEESGGFGFAFHLPERDALLALILVLSAMAERKASLSRLRADIAARFGHPHFHRVDIPLADGAQQDRVRHKVEELKAEPKLIGLESTSVSLLDGVKLHFPEGFLLLRFSGTEPLLRIYCEHQVESKELALIERSKEFLLAD